MVNLLVSESYALDYLSILEVKSWYNHSTKTVANFVQCLSQIEEELKNKGFTSWQIQDILESEEYDNLRSCNSRIFNLVNKIKKDPLLGLEVDKENFNRFKLKQILQEKFFKDNLKEEKFGYERN